MIDQKYADKNVKVMYNFTIHQLRILLEGNEWLLSAIENYEQKVTNTNKLDVIELIELLKSLAPPKKKPMDFYITLFNNLLENLDNKELEMHARDLLILVIQILRDPSQKLTQNMRDKMQKELCNAAGADIEDINNLIEEETERFLDGQANNSTEHMYEF
jgi:hypothetical protein